MGSAVDSEVAFYWGKERLYHGLSSESPMPGLLEDQGPSWGVPSTVLPSALCQHSPIQFSLLWPAELHSMPTPSLWPSHHLSPYLALDSIFLPELAHYPFSISILHSAQDNP